MVQVGVSLFEKIKTRRDRKGEGLDVKEQRGAPSTAFEKVSTEEAKNKTRKGGGLGLKRGRKKFSPRKKIPGDVWLRLRGMADHGPYN